MTEQQYIDACKVQFDAVRYGWGLSEQATAEQAYADDVPVADAVASMNLQHQIRRANRSA